MNKAIMWAAMCELSDASKAINAKRPGSVDGSAEAVRVATLALVVEAGEMLQCLDWKTWKRKAEPVDRQAAMEEFADMFVFIGNLLVNLTQMVGFTEYQLAEVLAMVVDRAVSRANGQVAGYETVNYGAPEAVVG